MTDLDLDQIEARANAATAGSWGLSSSEATMNDRSSYRFGPRSQPPVFLASQMRFADAEFIAHARQDVPALVAEVRRLRANQWPEWSQMLTNQSCEKGKHPDWFIDSEHSHRCPWCALDALQAERDAAVAEVRRLRAELDRFKPQPMSQQCRDGRHGKTGDWRCHNCRCLCHTFEHSRAGHDPACESLQREYDRTVGDLAVAVAEAARVREALTGMTETLERITTERNAFRDERNEAREALQAIRDRARSEIADAKEGEHYHAEVNNGAGLAAEQSRRRAWEAVVRALDAALDGSE